MFTVVSNNTDIKFSRRSKAALTEASVNTGQRVEIDGVLIVTPKFVDVPAYHLEEVHDLVRTSIAKLSETVIAEAARRPEGMIVEDLLINGDDDMVLVPFERTSTILNVWNDVHFVKDLLDLRTLHEQGLERLEPLGEAFKEIPGERWWVRQRIRLRTEPFSTLPYWLQTPPSVFWTEHNLPPRSATK